MAITKFVWRLTIVNNYIHPLRFLCALLSLAPLLPSGFHQRPLLVRFLFVSFSGSGAYPRVFTGALRSLLLLFTEVTVDGFLAWFACFCCFLLDVLHQFVMMAIASLSPLFSWLKGAPPGTYPSSCQQKKMSEMKNKMKEEFSCVFCSWIYDARWWYSYRNHRLDFNFAPKRGLLLKSRNRVVYMWILSIFTKNLLLIAFLFLGSSSVGLKKLECVFF